MSNEIDLTNVNWNTLNVDEWNKLEQDMRTLKAQSKSNSSSKRVTGYTTVKIKNETYRIKTVLYQRLKSMKSEKSKEKLIDSIISTHNPLEKL